MMKSKLLCNIQPASKYPCLMTPRNRDPITFVVLFTAPGEGTVVYTDGDAYDICHYSTAWTMETFIPFHGDVVLSN